MSLESVLIWSAMLAFAVFGTALAWADRRTQHLADKYRTRPVGALL